MTGVKLTEHYPHPTDAEQFDQDYREHLALFHRNADVPANRQQYTVTRFLAAGPDKPAYYQMFSLPFPSAEALQLAMLSPQMREVAFDAARMVGRRWCWQGQTIRRLKVEQYQASTHQVLIHQAAVNRVASEKDKPAAGFTLKRVCY